MIYFLTFILPFSPLSNLEMTRRICEKPHVNIRSK